MSCRTPIFFTSDWHIGHQNVLGYDNRPFTDLDHMHRVLINNYNACVPEDGVCYFLGDLGLTKGETLKKVVSELHGTKILIIGNHDKGVQAAYNLGFDVVLHGAMMYIAKERVTLSHCPLLNVQRENIDGMTGAEEGEHWHGEFREKNQRLAFENDWQFHLHGHIHSPNGGKSQKILDKQWDVGVAANKYTPVNISAIESWIATYGRT